MDVPEEGGHDRAGGLHPTTDRGQHRGPRPPAETPQISCKLLDLVLGGEDRTRETRALRPVQPYDELSGTTSPTSEGHTVKTSEPPDVRASSHQRGVQEGRGNRQRAERDCVSEGQSPSHRQMEVTY